MGWKNHTSKQRADVAICQSFECSLVKYRMIRGISNDPRVIRVRALLGYRIELASDGAQTTECQSDPTM